MFRSIFAVGVSAAALALSLPAAAEQERTPTPTMEFGSWGFDPAALDTSVKPGDDFFEFANGKWVRENPIPSEYTRFGAFNILREKSTADVESLVASLVASNPAAGTPERRIVDAAKPLFIGAGYEKTSMRQIAEAAGVSLQTLYNAFESKFGLFSRLMDVIVAGDHEPLALADRDDQRALSALTDAKALIAANVTLAIEILARLDEIYPVLRAAAASDAQIAEAHPRFTMHARFDDMRRVAEQLSKLPTVRRLDVDYIAETLWAILAPDTFDLLTTHRGWSTEQFAAWATDTLTATLLTR